MDSQLANLPRFDHLKKIASLLLNDYLEESTSESIKIAREISLPLVEQLKPLSDEALFALFRDYLEILLLGLSEGKAVETAHKLIERWKADKLTEAEKYKISSPDIITLYSIPKQLFLNFIPTFTNDCKEAVNIMKELEMYYLHLEQYAYTTYVDIQNKSLIEEKKLSGSLLDSSIDGILTWDRNFNITAWNSVLERNNKLSKEEVLGKHIFKIFPLYAEREEGAAMYEVLQGKKVHFSERPYTNKNGHFELNMIPLIDTRGEVTGGISIIRDITQRKKVEKIILKHKEELQSANEELSAQQDVLKEINAELTDQKENIEQKNLALEQEIIYRTAIEQELKKERSFIQAILNNMSEGIVACDETGTLSFFNQAAKDFHGYLKKSVKPKDWPEDYDLYQPDGKTHLNYSDIPLYKAFKGEKVSNVEMLIAPKNGAKKIVLSNGQPIIDPEGKKLGAVVVMHDISERKKAENELRKSRDYYLTILQDFPTLIWRSDNSAHYDYFNKTWLDFTGRSIAQELGEGWTEGIHSEDLEKYRTLYHSSFEKRQSFSITYRLRHHNGQYRWLLNFGKPIYGIEGNFLGFLGTCYDIQEQKEAEREISRKNLKLAKTLEKLKIAEERLTKMNNELEIRVKERTNELLASEKELKQTLDQTIELNKIISERENFLSNIIDQTPISTCIFDAHGTQVRVNKACLELFGVKDVRQGIGKYNILQDEVLIKTPFYNDIKAVFTEGKIAKFTVDYDLSKVKHVAIPTGVPVTVVTTIFPIKDNASGKVINAIVQHEDITERKNAEEALKASEEQLRLITDALPVLIAYVDHEERYRFNNRAYEDWFNIPREEIYGKTIREFAGDTAYSSLKYPIAKALQGEEFYQELHLTYKNTDSKYVGINYIPHFVRNKVAGYFTLINDISKQKEVQRALEIALQETNDKNEELQKINTDLDNFIYIASHDLKSPIVNLEGLILLLKKRLNIQDDEAETKILEMIDSSIDKFKKTILNLTEITKAQKNLDEEKELLFVPDLIKEVKEEIQEMIRKSGAQIYEDLEVEYILFAPMNLRSIIYNLLSNALKYSKPDTTPKVYIKTYKKGSNIILSVKDEGLGLTRPQQKKLFTMFKRMHNHVEGSGIGLYILKRIAENNGGKVEVESEIDKGTEFKVYFRERFD